MRASVQQETIRRVLAELLEMASSGNIETPQFQQSADTLKTLAKTPCLPDFNGPEVVWVGKRMFVK